MFGYVGARNEYFSFYRFYYIFFFFSNLYYYSQFVRDTIFSIAYNGQLEGHRPTDRQVSMRITMWATLMTYIVHCSSSLIYFLLQSIDRWVFLQMITRFFGSSSSGFFLFEFLMNSRWPTIANMLIRSVFFCQKLGLILSFFLSLDSPPFHRTLFFLAAKIHMRTTPRWLI